MRFALNDLVFERWMITTKQFNLDNDVPIFQSKLNCIWHQVEKYLLQPFFISFYKIPIFFKANELRYNIDIFQYLLVFLNLKDLIYSFPDVKLCELFGKILLIFVQDSVIQYIVHKEIYKLSGACDLVSWAL